MELRSFGRIVCSAFVGVFVTTLTAVWARAQNCTSALPPARGPIALKRVSLTDSGAETTTRPGLKNASHPTISDDGNVVAYESTSMDAIDPTVSSSNYRSQIYVREVAVPSTTRMISIRNSSGSLQAGNGDSTFAVISADASHVVFGSLASNLDPDDVDTYKDVFVHERLTRTTTRVTELANGTGFGCDSGGYATSSDGLTVSFVSEAKALDGQTVDLPGGGSLTYAKSTVTDVFVKGTGATNFEWLSQAYQGQHPDKNCDSTSISRDGQRVAFASEATNFFASPDLLGHSDVFLRDRTTGALELISVDCSGTGYADGPSLRPAISGDGRFVAFESYATTLLAPAEDNYANGDIFVRDTSAIPPKTVRVSLDWMGFELPTNPGHTTNNCGYAQISTDGRYVVFTSTACKLVPGDWSAGDDFFVHDRDIDEDGTFDNYQLGATRRLSQQVNYTSPSFQDTDGKCGGNCGITSDGKYAVFNCQASNLIPNDPVPDTNGGACQDVNGVPNGICGRDILRATIY